MIKSNFYAPFSFGILLCAFFEYTFFFYVAKIYKKMRPNNPKSLEYVKKITRLKLESSPFLRARNRY